MCMKKEMVNHPEHYQGKNGKEVIDVIERREMEFHLGNSFKYLARKGCKEGNPEELEIRKSKWYIDRFCEWYNSGKSTGDLHMIVESKIYKARIERKNQVLWYALQEVSEALNEFFGEERFTAFSLGRLLYSNTLDMTM